MATMLCNRVHRLCLLLLLSSVSWAFDAAEFAPRHFADLAKGLGFSRQQIFFADAAAYTTEARYVGKIRRIEHSTREFLSAYSKAVAQAAFFSLYEHEAEFAQGGTRIWLPVQGPVLVHLSRDLRPGESATLYFRQLGGLRGNPIAVLIEFEKTSPQPGQEPLLTKKTKFGRQRVK